MSLFSLFFLTKINKNLKILFCGRIIGNIIYFSLIPFLAFYLDSFSAKTSEIGNCLIFRSILYILGLFIGSILAELFNKKIFVFILLFFISILYFLLSFINYYYSLFYIINTIGFMSGLIYSSENVILVQSTSEDNRADVFSIINVILNISACISPLLATNVFLKNTSFAYIFMGILNMVYTFMFLFIDLQNIENNKKINSLKNEIYSFFKLLRDKKFILSFLSFMLSAICYCFLTSSLPFFLKTFYTTAKNIFAISILINTFIVILFQFLVSKLIKKIGSIKAFSISQIMVIFFFITINGIRNINILYFSVIILSFGELFKYLSENLLIVNNFKTEDIGKCLSFYKIINLFAIPISTFISTYCLEINNISLCFFIFLLISFSNLILLHFINFDKNKLAVINNDL